MEQYISKSALVAEIENRIKELQNLHKESEEKLDSIQKTAIHLCIEECKVILSLINTLEVKDFWKSADGDNLPEIDREVIALLDNGKVVFAHRPPEYWEGKDIVTGKITRNYPKTYDKGGWNIPDTKYWLDVELPKEIEL